MKTFFASFALTLLLGQAAQAAFPGGPKLAPVNQLAADVRGFSEMTKLSENCSLFLEKTGEGVRISLASQAAGQAQIDVRYDSAVLLSERYEESGDFVKVYEIPGQGRLTAVLADDSYFQATLETAAGPVSCEVDY